MPTIASRPTRRPARKSNSASDPTFVTEAFKRRVREGMKKRKQTNTQFVTEEFKRRVKAGMQRRKRQEQRKT